MKKFQLIVLISFIAFGCNEENKKDFLFSKLSESQTGIAFKNTIQDTKTHNIVSYIYYYNGGGVAVGDINNDNLPDIYLVSNTGDNKLYLNQGGLKFKDISQTAGVKGLSDWHTGVSMVDINNDGYLDIYLCSVSGLLNFKGHNELYINNGDGTFTEQSKDYGLDYKGYSTQAYFFDYDKDGDLDTYIVNHAVHTKSSHGPAQIRKKRTGLVGDVLLRNDNQFFKDASEEAKIYGGVNGYGLSASIADFNNDGWDDIYVCNDFHEDDYYYINNQDGTFRESLTKSFALTSRFSMGSDAVDINGDGYQDLITMDMLPNSERVLKESEGDVSYNTQDLLIKQGYQKQYSRNMLQLNNEGEFFTETANFNDIAATDWSWAPLIADYNQDGHQDIFITTGIYKRPNNLDFMKYISSSFKNRRNYASKDDWLLNSLKEMPDGKSPNQIYEGNSKSFKNQTGNWIENTPGLSNGAVYVDLDLDGDLDLVTNNLNEVASVYKNNTNDKYNFLKIKLDYKSENKNGIGTKVILYSKDKVQSQQLYLSRGFISALEPKIHFGLGKQELIDSLIVIWPDNSYQKINQPSINQELKISYSENTLPYNYTETAPKSKLFQKQELIEFTHKEDAYIDFNNEKLIPYKVSTAGPAIAVGDIDHNGYEDIFIGNASGERSSLFLNNGIKFKKTAIPEIEKDSLSEAIDAVFFDADNDGDLDLYVATGINATRNTQHENDRLYLNTGKGTFIKSKNNIPDNFLNTACVKPYDYDGDGDVDLFIGNRSHPDDFGKTVNSYILNNDGSGNFTIDKQFTLRSKVTSAIWADVNNDQIKDLIVSTEWDTPKIYINNKGVLSEKILPEDYSGLWQSVSTFDIDADGDQDIILGNWGLNSKFKASKESPLLMYHSDFDNNGKNETVLAYKIKNDYYPVNSKDELTAQMTIINKRFSNYKDFANQPIEKILTPNALALASEYSVSNLASGYLVNNNGAFDDFIEFPSSFQLSPITAFLKGAFINSGEEDLLMAGNFYA